MRRSRRRWIRALLFSVLHGEHGALGSELPSHRQWAATWDLSHVNLSLSRVAFLSGYFVIAREVKLGLLYGLLSLFPCLLQPCWASEPRI